MCCSGLHAEKFLVAVSWHQHASMCTLAVAFDVYARCHGTLASSHVSGTPFSTCLHILVSLASWSLSQLDPCTAMRNQLSLPPMQSQPWPKPTCQSCCTCCLCLLSAATTLVTASWGQHWQIAITAAVVRLCNHAHVLLNSFNPTVRGRCLHILHLYLTAHTCIVSPAIHTSFALPK